MAKTKFRVVVDGREHGELPSLFRKEASKKRANVEIEVCRGNLVVGDVLVNDLIIERKAGSDLVSSIFGFQLTREDAEYSAVIQEAAGTHFNNQMARAKEIVRMFDAKFVICVVGEFRFGDLMVNYEVFRVLAGCGLPYFFVPTDDDLVELVVGTILDWGRLKKRGLVTDRVLADVLTGKHHVRFRMPEVELLLGEKTEKPKPEEKSDTLEGYFRK